MTRCRCRCRCRFAVSALFAALLLTGCTGTAVPPGPAVPVTATASSSAAPMSPQEARRALTGKRQVTRVFDGDTLYARLAGDDVPVRFIGDNAPEVKHPNHPNDDCLGPQARERVRGLLVNGTVTLTYDRTQGDRDKYGRFLRYVNASPTGQDVALLLLQEGLAKEYTYNKPYERQAVYRTAQAEARAAHRGGWNTPEAGGCGWN